MRFGSYKDFTKYLKALSDIGYSVPFTDYELEMSNRGFRKHIHYYECDINDSNSNSMTITFVDNVTQDKTSFTFERNKNNGKG